MEFIDVDIEAFREATEKAVESFDGQLFSEGLYDYIRGI